MSITVHFHAAGTPAAGDTGGGTGAGMAVNMTKGMDAGASLPAAMTDDMNDGMNHGMNHGIKHVDSPATAIDAGGPPAALVSMVEAAFVQRGPGAQQAGADQSSGNDAGAAPQGV